MNRLATILLALVLAVTAAAAEVRTVKIAFVDRAGDPFYAHRESYGGIYDATRQPAVSGAELGVKDARIIGRAIGVAFQLLRETVPEGEAAAAFVRQLIAARKSGSGHPRLAGGGCRGVAPAGMAQPCSTSVTAARSAPENLPDRPVSCDSERRDAA